MYLTKANENELKDTVYDVVSEGASISGLCPKCGCSIFCTQRFRITMADAYGGSIQTFEHVDCSNPAAGAADPKCDRFVSPLGHESTLRRDNDGKSPVMGSDHGVTTTQAVMNGPHYEPATTGNSA